MTMKREEDALKAYTTILSQKGVGAKALIQREFVVMRLMSFLEDIPADGQHYRTAVDAFVASIDTSEVAYVLPVIREYFSFWVKDIKAIAGMSQDRAFETEASAWEPTKHHLHAMWSALGQIPLVLSEQTLLNQFLNGLRSRGADKVFIESRGKLAKFLLLGLREVPHKQPNAYRKVVDAHLSLFSNALNDADVAADYVEPVFTQQAFLAVAREFYYVWKGDVAVTSRIPEQEAMAA